MRTFMFYTEAIAVKKNAIGLIQICIRYYIGYSQDPWNRLIEHNNNSSDTYTGKTKDWEFKTIFEVNENRSDAIRIEKFIKKQKSRKFYRKIKIINYLVLLISIFHY